MCEAREAFMCGGARAITHSIDQLGDAPHQLQRRWLELGTGTQSSTTYIHSSRRVQ